MRVLLLSIVFLVVSCKSEEGSQINFNLVSSTHETFTEKEMKGMVSIIYFGFSACPQQCPMALAKMQTILNSPELKNKKVHGYFITIDPQQDTPQRMRDFMRSFGTRITGLTGSIDQITHVTRQFRVSFIKLSANTYDFNHSNTLFVLDKNLGLVEIYPADTLNPAIIERIKRLL